MHHKQEENDLSLKKLFVPLTTFKAIHIIVILGLFVFANSLFNGFVMDDENQILNAPIVHSITNLPKFFNGSTFGSNGNSELTGGFYRPFPTVIISMLYVLFGPNPFFFHLTQILLHICNSILVFLFFQQLLRKLKTSLILALLFLVHPINSEAVNYISAMQTTLSFFFGLMALLLFLKKSTRIYTLSVFILLFLSLLSKETGAIFLLLLLFIQWSQGKMNNRVLYLYVGGVLLIYTFLRLFVARVHIVTPNKFIPLMNLPFSLKLLHIPSIVFYYFHAFFFPNNIAVDQNWVIRTLTWQNFYFPLLSCLLIGLSIISVIFYLNKKNKHEFKLFLFFTFFFISFMVLTLPLLPLDFTVADRWFYFPMVGLLGMIGIAVQHIRFQNKFFRWILIAAIILIIGGLSLRTVIRNRNWYNNLTLFTHDVIISHDSFDLENNLGTALFRAGDSKEAEMHIKKSLILAPELPEALLNLGLIYEKKNDIANAKKYYLLAAQNGLSMGVENYVGALLFYENNASDSAKFLENKLGKYPLAQRLWLFLAVAYQRIGNQQSALRVAEYAYKLQPNQDSAYVYNRIIRNEPIVLK